MKKKKFFGFTLIEMVLMISIVSIVTAVGASSYLNSTKIARDNRRKTDLETVRQALELYKADNGEYPDVAGRLQLLQPYLANYIRADQFPDDPRNSYDYYYERDNYNPRKYILCTYLEKLTAVGGASPVPSPSALPSASFYLPSPSPSPSSSFAPSPSPTSSPMSSASLTPSSSPINLTFYAVDDAYLENGSRFNSAELRVEHTTTRTRTTYLKFNLSGFSQPPSQAKLILRNTDTGSRSGTYKLSLGSHSSWSETNLSTSNAPNPTSLLDVYSGAVIVGGDMVFDVTSAVTTTGTYTFILHMDQGAGNDLKFSSDEASVRPQLQVSAVLGSYTGKSCGTVECNYCITSP